MQTRAAVLAKEVRYDLEVKSHNDLCATRRSPFVLVLVVVDADEGKWASIDERTLRLHASAYWLSLAGRPEVSGRRKDARVAVSIPRRNRFTPDVVRRIMQSGRVGP